MGEWDDLGSRRRPTVPIARVDLRSVAEALDDHDYMTQWWFDPATGDTEVRLSPDYRIDTFDADDEDEDEDDPLDRGLVRVDSYGSRDAYVDMVDFADAVADHRAADLLQRALEGRGAFRRFRDTLADFAHLGEQWSAYSALRAQQRAIRWLVDEDLVDRQEAQAESARRDQQTDEILAAVARRTGPEIEASEVVERWAAVIAAIDSRETVTVTRYGAIWAYIEPAT